MTPEPSMTVYMVSTQPSSVMAWNMVKEAHSTLSKLLVPKLGLSRMVQLGLTSPLSPQRHCWCGRHVHQTMGDCP